MKLFIKHLYYLVDSILERCWIRNYNVICGNNNSEYKDYDDINTKISTLKSEGRLFDLSNFIELMGFINRENNINVDLHIPVYSPRSLLEHYLRNDEIVRSVRDTPLVEFMNNTSIILDRFDVLRNKRRN